MKIDGYRLAKTVGEIVMASDVIILNEKKDAIIRQGEYDFLKKDWNTKDAFLKRLYELIKIDRVLIKNGEWRDLYNNKKWIFNQKENDNYEH